MADAKAGLVEWAVAVFGVSDPAGARRRAEAALQALFPSPHKPTSADWREQEKYTSWRTVEI